MNLTFLRNKYLIGASIIAIIGAILRVWYLYDFSTSVLFDVAVGPDVSEYHSRALEVANGKIIADYSDIHAPLYSLLLGGLYSLKFTIPTIRILQLFAGWFIWIGLFFIIKYFKLLSEKENLLYLCISMVYPIAFFHQAELISEGFMLIILVGMIGLLYGANRNINKRKSLTFLSGIFGALATITHPMALIFIFFEWLLLIFNKRFKLSMLFALGVVAIILPLSITNSIKADKLVLIQSNSAFNLWLGNNPNSTGMCYIRPGMQWKELHRNAENWALENNSTSDYYFLKEIANFWINEPVKAFNNLFSKVFSVWSLSEEIAGADPAGVVYYTALVKYGRYMTLFLFFFGWIGTVLILVDRKKRHKYIHFILLFWSFYLMQILTVTSGRYRLAMLIAIYPFAAYGIFNLPYKNILLSIILATILIPMSVRVASLDANNNETMELYGEAYHLKGDYLKAKEYLKKASQSIDDNARFKNIFGLISVYENSPKEAEKYFLEAINSDPYEFESSMNLANLYSSLGRKKEAENLYIETLKKSPNYLDLRYNYALFLQKENRFSEALEEYKTLLEKSPTYANAWNAIGLIAFNNKNFLYAAECFEEALKIQKENLGFMLNLYQSYRNIPEINSDKISVLERKLKKNAK